MGVLRRSSSNDERPSRVWMALLEQHSPPSPVLIIIIIIIIIIIWCFILCERQFFYKNSLAFRTNQSKSHNITIYIVH